MAGGAFYPLFASLVADYFGERNAVRNFGVVYSAKLFGGIIGVGLPALVVASDGLTHAVRRRRPAQPVRRRHDAAAPSPRIPSDSPAPVMA